MLMLVTRPEPMVADDHDGDDATEAEQRMQ